MPNNLTKANLNTDYTIKSINTRGDEEMKAFLFTLGCYEGQSISVVSILHKNYLINVKNAKYSIDEDLAAAIEI